MPIANTVMNGGSTRRGDGVLAPMFHTNHGEIGSRIRAPITSARIAPSQCPAPRMSQAQMGTKK